MVRIPHARALWLSLNVLPYESALRQWLRRFRNVGLDADDIVQEAYARIAALETVENIRDPKSYFFQTAYSVITTHLRRSNVVSIMAISDVDMLGVAIDELSPERHLEAREELQKIADAISQLPKPYQEVLILRRVSGLSQRQVAERLGTTECVIEHRMAKVIKLLMDRFGRGGKVSAHASIDLKIHKLTSHDRRKH